jgi:CRISPR-associated endonuclease/helicase Cas3
VHDFTDEDDSALALGTVELLAHQQGVGALALASAERVGLPDPIAADAGLGGALHDIGKAEERFQILLWGGDRIRALAASAPLAKGRLAIQDRAAMADIRHLSGLPAGVRHECWSVSMITGSEVLALAVDPDLVIWLVGTHHGLGRPFFPVVLDRGAAPGATITQELEIRGQRFVLQGAVDHGLHCLVSGWAERFRRLHRRYGWWGLAYLEALVRLADHRRSEWEHDRAAIQNSGESA